MDLSNFLPPLVGGILIGLAATGLLLTHGRIMGLSGILSGAMSARTLEQPWRIVFLIGAISAGFFIPKLGYTLMSLPVDRGLAAALIGGLLVGIGTQLGSGCTSGHGICGISRFSARSLLATVTFITLGMLTVAGFNFIFGDTL